MTDFKVDDSVVFVANPTISGKVFQIDYQEPYQLIYFASTTGHTYTLYSNALRLRTLADKAKSYSELVAQRDSKTCVCGSHQPKGRGHSTWCEVYV